jgi:exonuclease SbcD
MRLLHTADLHLGRQFNGISLETDHAAVLDQIVSAIISNSVDVLIIAGDIFDRAAPPTSAVRQFNDFLARVASETTSAVIMIAGNHDSGDRIAAMSVMTDTRRALIRGAISADERPLVLTDAYGPVAFTGLPFAYEYAARECFTNEALHTPEDVLAAQVACGRRNIPDGARWVVVSHAFIAGASSSEGERPLTRVGGVETVSSAVFEGAHYVALGHLHRPQSVGASHVRYSGSPLAFGFDETDCEKSMSLVEVDAVGRTTIETIPFEPIRRVRVVRGRHAELLLTERSDDLIKVVLTDDAPVIDGMKRIRGVFPNACELVYERNERVPEVKSLAGRAIAVANPLEVIGDFLEHIRDERLSENELVVVASALGRLRETEDMQ